MPRICPEAPLQSPLPEAMSITTGKQRLLQWSRKMPSGSAATPSYSNSSVILGFLFSFPIFRNLSLKMKILPWPKVLACILGCENYSKDPVKILSPPKSKCPALAATTPAQPVLAAGFFHPLLVFLLFCFSFPFISPPVLSSVTSILHLDASFSLLPLP